MFSFKIALPEFFVLKMAQSELQNGLTCSRVTKTGSQNVSQLAATSIFSLSLRRTFKKEDFAFCVV